MPLALQVIASTEVFGQVRCLSSFRLPGAPTDYIVVGSDSGRIVILHFSEARRAFVKVHQETFGRSGCRRIVPGQYAACDPTGRAVMIAAVEKQKFLYVLNRDSANQLTISSPLEAHKSRHVVFALAALDNGFENPLFAAVELDYTGVDEDATGEEASEAQKKLVYYELDLGLNTVVRKWMTKCDNGAPPEVYMLINGSVVQVQVPVQHPCRTVAGDIWPTRPSAAAASCSTSLPSSLCEHLVSTGAAHLRVTPPMPLQAPTCSSLSLATASRPRRRMRLALAASSCALKILWSICTKSTSPFRR